MDQKSQDFSPSDAQRLLDTPAGQQLARQMEQEYGDLMQQAMALVLSGQPEQARQLLAPLLESEQTRQLLEKLGGSHG